MSIASLIASALVAGLSHAVSSNSSAKATVNRTLEVIVSRVDPKNQGYSRREYEGDVIALALSKTRETDGPFSIIKANFWSNSARELRMMRDGKNRNFVRSFVVDTDNVLDPGLAHIDFPVMRGALGYRVCLISMKTKQLLSKVESFEQFSRFSHIQGLGWQDIRVLEHAGLRVITASAYSSIVKMAARNRADLYCRAPSEVQSDFNLAKKSGLDLVIDDSYLLFYPMPRYFFAKSADKEILARIERGLNIAYQDGSFIKLWEKYHLAGIMTANLQQRKILVFDNPLISALTLNFRRYFYQAEGKEESIRAALDKYESVESYNN